VGCSTQIPKLNDQEKCFSKIDALKLASKYAEELGYDVNSMNIEISKYNQPYNEYFPKDEKDEYAVERRNKLKGKNYFAVYFFTPIRGNIATSGGDVCVFIDTENGNILTDYRGK